MFQCGIVRDCSTIPEEDEEETPTTSASTSAELASGADQAAIIPNNDIYDASICRGCGHLFSSTTTATVEDQPAVCPFEDALPGIPYPPEMFPSEFMQLNQKIPEVSISHFRIQYMRAVKIGEVYSPSHFWFYMDDCVNAVEEIMEQMTALYVSDWGKGLCLSRAAIREGHYCAATYFGEWHRAVIVRIVDDDHVKVRYVDYGTVGKVATTSLRPLLQAWGTAPSQAIRGRLGGLQPAAGGHHWPYAASVDFIQLVTDQPFLAKCKDCYLNPSFDELESGAVPNIAEINAHLKACDQEVYWPDNRFDSSDEDEPSSVQSNISQDLVGTASCSWLQEDCLLPLHQAENALHTSLDADVFPADCMQFGEVIRQISIVDIRKHDMFEVRVAEVVTPSHFWFFRLGDDYHIAFESIMDDMFAYFTSNVGKGRYLDFGAVREGQYCAAMYKDDWHRAVIVKIIDNYIVKVRHVDYGSVMKVDKTSLRPLLREWAELPAQAIRGRTAGLKPAGKARHWTLPATKQFVQYVQDRTFFGRVAAIDQKRKTLELFLIDTTTEDDVCATNQMVSSGHGDLRTGVSLWSMEDFTSPSFESLESGTSPNMDEVEQDLYNKHGPASLELKQGEDCGWSSDDADFIHTQADIQAEEATVEEEPGPSTERRVRSSEAAKKKHRRDRRAAQKNNKPVQEPPPPPPPPLF